MAPSVKELLQESLHEFSEGLESSVPLRHFMEHKDDARLKEAIQLQSDKVFLHLNRKIKVHAPNISFAGKGDLMKEFWSEVEKVVKAYLSKNQDYKAQSEAFLEEQINACCKGFRTSIEAKLLMNPDVELKAVEEFVKDLKMKVMDCFELMWKQGNIGMFEEQKAVLKRKLIELKKEMLEKHSRCLQLRSDEEARKSLAWLKEIILEMSRQFECDIAALQPQGLKPILKEKVQGIRDTLISKGKVVKEKYGKLYWKLLGLLESSMQFLGEAAEAISLEDAAGWMKKLNMQLQACFVQNEKDEKIIEIQQAEKICNESVTHDVSQDGGIEVQPVTSIQREADLINNDNGIELDSDLANIVEIEGADDDILEVAIKRLHQEMNQDVAEENEIVSPPASKRLRQTEPDNAQKEGSVRKSDENNVLNVPDKYGSFPLLRAILRGEGIEKMLDNGANVNVTESHILKFNAAHYVILSLILKDRDPTDALVVLNLLVAKGFNLINGRDFRGCTPLHHVMTYEDVNEEILSWFFNNRADFNSVDKFEDSPLLRAIQSRRSEEIIQKMIHFGCNPKHVNIWKQNALHTSARFANESALEIFIDQLDKNEVDEYGNAPLHCLFENETLEYERCLEILIKKGADFGAECHNGYVPLVKWMFYKGNPFPALVKMKNMLPITEEISSATLTAIASVIESKREFFPSSSPSPHNEFVQFILCLINEKKAELLWNEEVENEWKQFEWEKLDKAIFTRDFFRKLKTAAVSADNECELVGISSGNLGELNLHTNVGIERVKIEPILSCMLACKNYLGFVEVCRFVSRFLAL